MIVRPMQPQDIDLCAHLVAQTPLWQRYGVSEASARQRFELGLQNKASIAVAEQEGSLLGFVWVSLHGAFERSSYIPLIGVMPGQYGRGVGQALMDAAEELAFQHTAELFLLVSDFNQAAQRFYQRRGFTQVGALNGYILPDVTELIYMKRRPAPTGG
jgi:ribosomal protein S18 acetylase RimI-like enzyme